MKVPISVGKFENIFIFIKQSINIKIWLDPSPWQIDFFVPFQTKLKMAIISLDFYRII